MSRTKIYILLSLLAFPLGYLQWGDGNHEFLFESEAKILGDIFRSPAEYFHPLILGPLLGQIFLIVSLFQKKPGKFFVYTGLIFQSVLMFFVLVAGLMWLHPKSIISTLPFIFFTVMVFRSMRKKLAE